MKQSEFNYISHQDEFKIAFRGALSLLIAEIIDEHTAVDFDLTAVTQFEKKRRDWAYSMKGQNGSIDRFVSDLRPMFPVAEVDAVNKYAPFTMNDAADNLKTQKPDGVPDVDTAEGVIYDRIKSIGFVNYWANALPEDRLVILDLTTV